MAFFSRVAPWLVAVSVAAPVFAQAPAAPNLTAAEIVERNAVARGGVEAWRKTETMSWAGHVESANVRGRNLPFLLEQKRPDRTRFELVAEGQRSLRVYDGNSGWKLRPASNGKPELQAYSEEELRFAHVAQVIDGPLMDAVAKRGVITLAGLGDAGGRKAYILDVKLPSGGSARVWVDAENFLELRHDRDVRNAYGKVETVTVFYRDYRDFEGLMLPLTVETGASAGKPMTKLVIERVALNPVLDDRMFAKPSLAANRRRGVVVDTRSVNDAQRGSVAAIRKP